MAISKELAILRLMNEFHWSKPFCTEYFMERNYNGLSHSQAFDNAMKSTWINSKDKPRQKPERSYNEYK